MGITANYVCQFPFKILQRTDALIAHTADNSRRIHLRHTSERHQIIELCRVMCKIAVSFHMSQNRRIAPIQKIPDRMCDAVGTQIGRKFDQNIVCVFKAKLRHVHVDQAHGKIDFRSELCFQSKLRKTVRLFQPLKAVCSCRQESFDRSSFGVKMRRKHDLADPLFFFSAKKRHRVFFRLCAVVDAGKNMAVHIYHNDPCPLRLVLFRAVVTIIIVIIVRRVA